MTQPAAADRVDTRDMNAVHTLFRREYRLAGEVVRRVEPGDIARAAVVGDHVEFINAFLHHHHTAEDEYLWPLLLDRVPDELAPIVHLMEAQHAEVGELVGQVATFVVRWREQAAVEDRDRLAELLDQLHAELAHHLETEEQRLLPIAARSMTSAEWQALGERSLKAQQRKDLPLVLGMIQYEADPEVVAGMIAEAPWLLRLTIPRMSRRKFRKHASAIHGTPAP